MANTNRLNALLSDETQAQLMKLMSRNGGSKIAAIRRSVALATYIEDAVAQGGIVQVKKQDGTIEQIVFI